MGYPYNYTQKQALMRSKDIVAFIKSKVAEYEDMAETSAGKKFLPQFYKEFFEMVKKEVENI